MRLLSRALLGALPGAAALGLGLVPPSAANVVFDDCQPTADGGVTCDTRPTGETRVDDEAARFGLYDAASPGWNEFEPFEADDEMFGGNET
ncbi:hypothetical protein [Cyanobium sp. NS01]|jgi:hypothetical protein|uniref:hypothetical protein n=1 Tax=Cyanobium sp. NS01 TaxID=261284 RepID=UPI001860C441|nr:hypothetical protein [Cyanobium sp. NS01]QNI71502.1 hypothetical protein CyaNS01_02385 [Cyanobium sp. NS01]